MKKEVKKCIKYYLENINSVKYKEYKATEDSQKKISHREYIAQEEPQWKNRVDYFDNSVVTHIVIVDILSNEGVAKLLNKIYLLPKDTFKIYNYYRKPSLINKYDYVSLQYSHSKCGRLAEIDFLQDKYIKNIQINWTQSNSYFAFIEYTFTFKQYLNDELYNKFIYDNITNLNSKDYLIWGHISEDKISNYLILEQMNEEYFQLICQHYITSLLYSEQGKMSRLINMIYRTRKEPINIEKLYLGDLSLSYYNKEKNYVILSEYDEVNYFFYAGNNEISVFSVCLYISKWGNEFYNRFFGSRELVLFENNFTKFCTGRKKIFFNKNLKKLFNKMQSVSNVENKEFDDFYKEFKNNWEFYISNDKCDLEEYHANKTPRIEEVYKENFSYFKLLSEMNYTKSSHLNSVISTIVSIIATVISVIALLQS